ncbi:YdeI/OmpD-associated family protein [Solitalea lacus]|uniref:YdeI/OmpD-associated family protein n=1 Tax=Solitalea lacus TaxID=2911172 RepID=UPI001EDBA2EE|nr:YdeI/OmpD-associated family protein [Solitalea lacus]UKJ06312.1 YdeI/OmpD-associated family protein [Solitalea lacus]
MPQNPLHKKLRIQPGNQLLLVNAPTGFMSLIEPLPEEVTLNFELKGLKNDVVLLFVKNMEELIRDLSVVVNALKPNTVFWICYPKKTSSIKSDLSLMDSWKELDEFKLSGVAAASVDDTWTALRFRPYDQIKKSEVCNEEIKQNEFSEFIDVENRQVNLPPDLNNAMQSHPASLTAFQKLSYTNKKEYVLWILTAKQDKTRVARIDKAVEKLILGKKNPAEK